LKNRSKTSQSYLKVQKIEIKNSKNTRVLFKIFGQNRIQKIEFTHPTQFGEGNLGK
jgi:hypothetical protein